MSLIQVAVGLLPRVPTGTTKKLKCTIYPGELGLVILVFGEVGRFLNIFDILCHF
jgi:hypothetical protein